jgi:hypothetical protein
MTAVPEWCAADACTVHDIRRFSVVKLQRGRHRSSACSVVDNSVDDRWKELAYAGNRLAMGCFCCRFGTLILCMKKPLPKTDLPTMLCVQ